MRRVASGGWNRGGLAVHEAGGRVPGEGVAGARRRHLGGARRTAPLHPLQDHGLGRHRSGRGGIRRRLWRRRGRRWSPPLGPAGGSDEVCGAARPARGRVHAVVRQHGARRQRAGDARRVSSGQRSRAGHGGRDRNIWSGRLRARYGTEHGTDGLPGSEARSWRAASGWRTTTLSADGWPTRRYCSTPARLRPSRAALQEYSRRCSGRSASHRRSHTWR